MTGASSGVGHALALALAHEGCEVIGVGRRARPDFGPKDSARIRSLAIDRQRQDGVTELRKAAGDIFDRVDILVSNVGHDQGGGCLFHEHATHDWLAVLRVNLESAMCLSHACLPAMAVRDQGDNQVRVHHHGAGQ